MADFGVHGNSLPETYHNALIALNKYGDNVACPDWNCTQKECTLTMYVKHPLQEPMISRLFIGGAADLQQYVMEMLDGILDFEIDQGNWPYTYHSRMGRQIEGVINELKRNPLSRRACITVRYPDDITMDDPPCLQHIQYFIRNGELCCKVLFRSNDAVKATFMNAFALIMLQKRIADRLNVPIGYYTHTANSFHAYEKDFDLLDAYVKRIESGVDLTFEYEGDWKFEMCDSIDGIMAKVGELKKRSKRNKLDNMFADYFGRMDDDLK